MATPTAAPIMAGRGSSSGSKIVLYVFLAIGGVVLLLFLIGMFSAFFLVRTASPPPPPAVVISPPAIPTIPAVPKVAASASTDGLAKKLRSFGSAGTGPGQLDDARELAVDLDENVYVADYDDGRVQKLDKDGKFVWITSIPKNAFAGGLTIFGLATDTKGTLWVNRTGDIIKLSMADGSTQGTIKGDYDSTWFHGIAVAPTGEIITMHSAAGNTDLLRLDAKGKVVSRVKNKDAQSLAIDGKKNAYLTLRFPDSVEVIDEKGAVTAKFGSKGDPHISGADGIAVDGNGHVFVSVSSGVSVFDSGGKWLGEIKGAHGRAIAISNSGHLFVLTNTSTIDVYELGKIE